MREDSHSLRHGALTATIASHGAELCSLRHHSGVEFIWQAGPAWPRHAPILFPIVGRLNNDELRHRGESHRMTQHGFARDLPFAWLERNTTRCALLLSDSATTRAAYPFPFRLEAAYSLDDTGLEIAFKVINTGEAALPASLGGHPAFNWPLLPELSKEAYSLTFAQAEPGPVRRLKNGLLRAGAEPTPVRGTTLRLAESLFADDAIIFDAIGGTSVRYAAERGPWIDVSWTGFRELGVWSKPSGAPFLCIEPWRGYASPSEFDGEFADKPGLMHIAPGAEQRLAFRIEIGMS